MPGEWRDNLHRHQEEEAQGLVMMESWVEDLVLEEIRTTQGRGKEIYLEI